jgi:uncharacterized protein YndB with AHSA1/START domain
MDKPLLIYSTFIKASPESVWRALTEGEFTREYWGGRSIASDWKVGAPVKYLREDGRIDVEGQVLEARPPHRLSYTFHMLISESHEAEVPTIVTFEIEPLGEVVKLTLTHEYSDRGKTYETTYYGWPAILSSLKSLLETGSALPFAGLGFGPGQKQNA